jgi:hypothetical protein
VITAIYHLSIQIITRGKGKSAVAAAAYRSGEKLANDYDGQTHDYTRKKGVLHTEIILPPNAPLKYAERSALWNAVEEIEKTKTSQLAREINIALPKELSLEQNLELVREYFRKNFVAEGMCADIAIHDQHDNNGNVHAHIMLTTRGLNSNGTWAAKERKVFALDEHGERIPLIDPATGLQKVDGRNRKQWKREYVQSNDWNSRANAELWRESWANLCNEFLERHNHSERIDHRSYERQGLEIIPTIHLGAAVSAMERKGIRTAKGNLNREIHEENRLIRMLKNTIVNLGKSIADVFAKKPEVEKVVADYPKSEPIMAKLMRFSDNGFEFNQTATPKLRHLKDVRALKNVAAAIAFVEQHNISDEHDLSAKLAEYRKGVSELKPLIQKKNIRVSELTALLKDYEIYKQNKSVLTEYCSIKSLKRQAKFFENNRAAIDLAKSARAKLPDKLTPKAWRGELDSLHCEISADKNRIEKLEDRIIQAETIELNLKSLDRFEEGRREQAKYLGKEYSL